MVYEYDVFEIPQKYLDMSLEEIRKEKERMFKEIKKQPPNSGKKNTQEK